MKTKILTASLVLLCGTVFGKDLSVTIDSRSTGTYTLSRCKQVTFINTANGVLNIDGETFTTAGGDPNFTFTAPQGDTLNFSYTFTGIFPIRVVIMQ